MEKMARYTWILTSRYKMQLKNSENDFMLQEVQTGLSDGIYIQINNGLTIEDEIKVQPLYSVN